MTSPGPPDHDDKPLRKDAQRTRRLVLDAAQQLFAEYGVEVGFDEIARVAGVGTGTVYRRFPDRNSLVEALFVEKVREIIGTAQAALAIEDPWESVVWYCEQSVQEMQRDRGLAQVLTGVAFGHDRFGEFRERIATTVGQLVHRAQAAGVMRPDLQPPDLALLSHLVSRVALADGTELWRRYLVLVLDAIRADPGHTALPGPVPTLPMFEEVARRL